MSSPRDRPDATVRRGHATAVVSGDRALERQSDTDKLSPRSPDHRLPA